MLNEKVITGVMFTAEITEYFQDSDDRVFIIRGLLACPDCGSTLDKDFNTGLWNCYSCRSVYDTASLVAKIERKSG